ncbi:uncharacterized protein DEA37_0011105 [Paragonimus westermani]|uniref:Uncharacterized protein n=1 Tax=Paragonimus westermani TaxID=34504 RepID=A0A5J4NTF8_9TREM|nr:uncharacterized protein DEA37_0011105 [Paragonimus westermani]
MLGSILSSTDLFSQVVPVTSETEEPATLPTDLSDTVQPIVVDAINPWNQAPPRPPRQRSNANQTVSAIAQPTPSAISCHLSAESTGLSSLPSVVGVTIPTAGLITPSSIPTAISAAHPGSIVPPVKHTASKPKPWRRRGIKRCGLTLQTFTLNSGLPLTPAFDGSAHSIFRPSGDRKRAREICSCVNCALSVVLYFPCSSFPFKEHKSEAASDKAPRQFNSVSDAQAVSDHQDVR